MNDTMEPPDYAGLLRAARIRFAIAVISAENNDPDISPAHAKLAAEINLRVRQFGAMIRQAQIEHRRGNWHGAVASLTILLQRGL
jgi:hypothetical protein